MLLVSEDYVISQMHFVRLMVKPSGLFKGGVYAGVGHPPG